MLIQSKFQLSQEESWMKYFLCGFEFYLTAIKKAFRTLSVYGTLPQKKRRLPTLPRVCSTIGAGGLNCSVRNGKRWDPATIATSMTIMTNHDNKHEHKRRQKNSTQTYRTTHARTKLFGQLVALGCDVTASTPAPYQRHRL